MATGLAEIPRTQFAEWSVPDAVIENGSFRIDTQGAEGYPIFSFGPRDQFPLPNTIIGFYSPRAASVFATIYWTRTFRLIDVPATARIDLYMYQDDLGVNRPATAGPLALQVQGVSKEEFEEELENFRRSAGRK